MSEWNKNSGYATWEERDFSKWGRDRFKDLFQDENGWKELNYKGTVKVPKVDGDFFLLFSHGKVKNIIHLDETKIIFASTEKDNASGSVTIEVDDDIEFKFVYKTRPDNYKDFEKTFKKYIEDNIAKIRKELAEKVE
ncbi:hypothetical protein EIN_268380 [Entamoeba invadens IP1]|uniref:Activator of Hsp90 ATPase AHSA1-like N-terminal domain-containing protein n=1 Tax=Entamoeba invadens IP1 TaxID=370355 RepID=A0A0A1UBN7_ENTIV|nr:hypothetical protein EIN_268380 [Entamoeba invadens IP1]ELP91092.1 hypothetical protein EIN_268380 [Entamoeba invadens IP1]|eukprot:XP_004257863.1 hypothetical protein EIN_268380 [Entamoeba invadens IP1]